MRDESELLIHVKRIEDLLSALLKRELSDVLEKELSDDNMRKIYDLTGEFTARELSEETCLSIATISRVWQRWENLGLMVKEGKKYRKLLNKN